MTRVDFCFGSLLCCSYYKGFHADLNETHIVGDPAKCDEESKKLLRATYNATMQAIAFGESLLAIVS